MQVVYMLTHVVDDETEEIVGVYSNLERAKDAAVRHSGLVLGWSEETWAYVRTPVWVSEDADYVIFPVTIDEDF